MNRYVYNYLTSEATEECEALRGSARKRAVLKIAGQRGAEKRNAKHCEALPEKGRFKDGWTKRCREEECEALRGSAQKWQF
jgi:hypothetical protein